MHVNSKYLLLGITFNNIITYGRTSFIDNKELNILRRLYIYNINFQARCTLINSNKEIVMRSSEVFGIYKASKLQGDVLFNDQLSFKSNRL